MLQGNIKLKLEDAFRAKKRVHYALQFANKQHIICIHPQFTQNNLISCKIMKCECDKQHDVDENQAITHIYILPKAGEKLRSASYKCDYYSNTNILLKKNQIVYTCGCSTGMYSILEERIKQITEED